MEGNKPEMVEKVMSGVNQDSGEVIISEVSIFLFYRVYLLFIICGY